MIINIMLRKEYLELQNKANKLEEENSKLKEKIEKDKIKAVNKETNQPSSKKAEWEKGSTKKDTKDAEPEKKKRKKRKRKKRKGSGNQAKNVEPNQTVTVTVEKCDLCEKDLSDIPPLKSVNERTIEDIPDVPEETIITLAIQQKKYCDECQEVITAKSDLALPKSDIGLNATTLICYLWVALCLPYPKIQEYLLTFFKLQISTSGLSKHVIRVAGIMKDVYREILENVNNCPLLQADETGWRVRGENWWLWFFGNQDTAYFTVDKSRGKVVVRRVLGEIFFGVLVVDGWGAYLSLICEQQSCLAHVFRKIRKFRGHPS